jgi:hypothetical protein
VKTNLRILDRILLLNTLEGITTGYSLLKDMRELRESLAFSQEEIDAHSVVFDGSQVKWNQSGDITPKEVEVAPGIALKIKAVLEKMDREETLTEKYLILYTAFVIGEKG